MAFINSRTLFANKERIEQLVTVLKSLEWAVPTPEAMCDGACPSCYAGKPGYGVLATVKFERKNHMKVCELADALSGHPHKMMVDWDCCRTGACR
jgi:hypothetical protein